MTRQELERRLKKIRRELEEASEGRFPAPRLIVVTKTHGPEEILPLRDLGITDIGENRVQELKAKLPALGDAFQVHLIGRLQRNKVKQIITDVCMIQSVDSLPLAEEIHRRAMEAELVMPVLVEISPAGEPQKGGVSPRDLKSFLKTIAPLEGLRVKGLMAVMPDTDDEEYLDSLLLKTRQLFDSLREEGLRDIGMEEVSMGMSGGYRLAARRGATMVRSGSAILRPRV